ncbi:hypothetical protein BKA61DRAFT_317411 [Leptodontidium sp. MPI-SDFR-AT-0119]|nr:hypothetical protein BKA61DRAFT_317411 [Leptodontidium sp. MPI-SDFR-AT-0119]
MVLCRASFVLFARSLRLMTAESTRSRQGQVIVDIHDIFTWFVGLQKTDLEKYVTLHASQPQIIALTSDFSKTTASPGSLS